MVGCTPWAAPKRISYTRSYIPASQAKCRHRHSTTTDIGDIGGGGAYPRHALLQCPLAALYKYVQVLVRISRRPVTYHIMIRKERLWPSVGPNGSKQAVGAGRCKNCVLV